MKPEVTVVVAEAEPEAAVLPDVTDADTVETVVVSAAVDCAVLSAAVSVVKAVVTVVAVAGSVARSVESSTISGWEWAPLSVPHETANRAEIQRMPGRILPRGIVM